MVLYTIGHSTRSYDELVAVLRAHGVTTLVDVRRFARSRTNPQFDGAALATRLPGDGIAYVAMPVLGGRRLPLRPTLDARSPKPDNAGWREAAFRGYADYALTAEWRAAFAELLALAAQQPCAIMCAEAVWWRCHRRIIADHALARGVHVVHIFTATKAEDATLTPFARVTGDRVTYPGGDAEVRRDAARAQRRRPSSGHDGHTARAPRQARATRARDRRRER